MNQFQGIHPFWGGPISFMCRFSFGAFHTASDLVLPQPPQLWWRRWLQRLNCPAWVQLPAGAFLVSVHQTQVQHGVDFSCLATPLRRAGHTRLARPQRRGNAPLTWRSFTSSHENTIICNHNMILGVPDHGSHILLTGPHLNCLYY